MKQRIIAFHLLNDKSGSPKVLRQLLLDWANDDQFDVHLFSSQSNIGFLSNLDGVNFHHAWYKFSSRPWLRLIFYCTSQFLLMLRLLFFLKKNDLVYINTVLPFGAALIAKLKSCRIIYHVHEVSINPRILKWFLLSIIKKTADEIIYVSNDVKNVHKISHIPSHIVYNTLEQTFLNALEKKETKASVNNILMVCSLKKYKGVFEFLHLAKALPKYQFKLVLNATEQEIKHFFIGYTLPKNLLLFPSQNNLHPFYQWADLILNLSRPDEWIETFGLTIIEGMAYGLPAIVPPVGGILEVIENGVTGFAVDSRVSIQLIETVERIMEDKNLYNHMSKAALKRLDIFNETTMLSAVRKILQNGVKESFPF